MKKTNVVRTVIRASIRGAFAILLVTMLGYAVGLFLEACIGCPIVSFEMVPFGVMLIGTQTGILIAIAGAVSGTWRRGLAIGLLGHGLLFGFIAWMSALDNYPFAVNCWVFAIGTIGGGVTGAMG